MHPIIIKVMDRVEQELTDLLQRCKTHDQILTHFSTYLLAQQNSRDIEDYAFFPEVSANQTKVRVQLYFNWDNLASHEFTITKKDDPTYAYDRAMGVI
jgi:hypothetical protein